MSGGTVGQFVGEFFYRENTGTATSPAFAARTGSANPLDGQLVASVPSPALADLDRDGDLDLVASRSGGFYYFENTGSAVSPAFIARTGSAHPLESFGVAGLYSAPAFGDVDGDGDLDLFSGDEYGMFSYFENAGSATDPVFVAHHAYFGDEANPLLGEDVGSNSSPAMGDLDGDGDVDVVTGVQTGTFTVHYFPEPARGLLLATGIALLKTLERLRKRRG